MSADCRQRHDPIFDVHPVTGTSFEIYWTDTALETFGRSGAGWFWQVRERGYAPEGPAHGPFGTSYSAYRNAILSPRRYCCRLEQGQPQG